MVVIAGEAARKLAWGLAGLAGHNRVSLSFVLVLPRSGWWGAGWVWRISNEEDMARDGETQRHTEVCTWICVKSRYLKHLQGRYFPLKGWRSAYSWDNLPL